MFEEELNVEHLLMEFSGQDEPDTLYVEVHYNNILKNVF